MISGEKLVYIFDIDEDSVNADNGDRTLKVANCQGIVGFVDLVGIQTQQLGQSQGHKFNFSVQVPRIYYEFEKYCYFEDQLYEVQGLGKAKTPTDLLLNVSKSNEHNVLEAIIKWLEEQK